VVVVLINFLLVDLVAQVVVALVVVVTHRLPVEQLQPLVVLTQVAVAVVKVLNVVVALVVLVLSLLKFPTPAQLHSLPVLRAPCLQLLQGLTFILLLQRLPLLKP
jgi:hypothetical protein